MAINRAMMSIKFSFDQTGANLITPQGFFPKIEKSLEFLSGTLADQCDLGYAAERSVAASTNDDLDLAGVLADAFGATITAAELVGFVINNLSTTQTLTVGGGSNPLLGWIAAAGDAVLVKPRGFLAVVAPDASGLATVTAGTGDILRIANNAGATALYEIGMLFRTA